MVRGWVKLDKWTERQVNQCNLAVEAVYCEPVSDAHSLFSGKIQGNLPVLAQEVGPDVTFLQLDQWVRSHFPRDGNREFFSRSRE